VTKQKTKFHRYDTCLAIRLGNVYTDNMASNANSVNIKSYHHGDLRSAVVEEGLRLLHDREAESLSLREIARNVGVSATALYRHFPDKASLLEALAEAGYAQLAREQGVAAAVGGSQGFAAMGQAYVHFALANPALFRLIFVAKPMNTHPGVAAPEGTAASLLQTGVAQLMGPDAAEEARFAAMLRAWSLVHGLAMLILDGQVDRPVAESMIAEIISEDSLNFA
jgi:AcrR family transcriptional regulator